MSCNHKFVGPPICVKCGVHIRVLHARAREEMRAQERRTAPEPTRDEPRTEPEGEP